MKNLLGKYFGFKKFYPLQEDVINAVLNKEDVFVLMPTGGGKSLCYQLPALKFKGVTLVISPLIALMKDQVDSLRANGISAEFINSSLSLEEIKKCEKRILEGKVKILYIAPERMMLKKFSDFLEKINISLIAVDEAHCISEWGHDFRPDYRNMKNLKKDFPETSIMALTATATKKVQNDILEQLNLPNAKVFISSFDRGNLKLRIIKKENALQKLLKILENYRNESVIIYCFSRKDTERLSSDLQKNGYNTRAYHAGMKSKTRSEVQELFIKDKTKIIVATIAFGMGINKLDVRLIVHYSLPKSLEGYYQEIGRAGRDGLSSECVMFYSYADTSKHLYFIDQISSQKIKEQAEKKLQKVIDYTETSSCKRKYLLDYFGEEYHKENCKGCDSCLIKKEEFDATTVSQKIISAVVRLEGRFGMNYVVDILKGKNKKQIKEKRHHLLSVYGIVNDFTDDNLKELIKALVDKGILKRAKRKYPVLSVTEKGFNFLKNRERLKLPKPNTEDEDVFSKREEVFIFDVTLFEKLRALRKKIADEMRVPSFVVFSDVSLQEMAHYLPCNSKSFRNISGVGEKKLNSFGDAFLKVIKEHAEEN
jgi:ATP-dependent DNA helicase RecQ